MVRTPSTKTGVPVGAGADNRRRILRRQCRFAVHLGSIATAVAHTLARF